MSMKICYAEYITRLHSDWMCATSPMEATVSTHEEKLECWATALDQFRFSICGPNKKL
jgi:hypothetical protein